jgi:hypothetical protein
LHGHGKIWLSDGRVFFGEFRDNVMSEGKLCELEKDKTYTLYKVKYDVVKDEYTDEED